MKRLFQYTTIAILFFTVSNSKAQSLDLGIKAGINYASISSIDSDGRLGFTGGIFAGVRFIALALQTEVLFSQQGGKLGDFDIETDYALVPVIAKLHFLRIFNLQLGPQFSFLINDTEYADSEQLDVSGAVGLGVNLGSAFSLDARYNFGFSDAFKGASGENKFISLSLGYSFL